MKANELSCKDLMVGDWVTGKKWRENPFKLTRINDNRKYYYGETASGELVGPFLIEEIEPIPIIKDILEKNGFEKCEGNEWSFFEEEGRVLYDVLWNADELYLDISSYTSRTGEFYRMGIEFVHQLQQALRICGIDKEIEL